MYWCHIFHRSGDYRVYHHTVVSHGNQDLLQRGNLTCLVFCAHYGSHEDLRKYTATCCCPSKTLLHRDALKEPVTSTKILLCAVQHYSTILGKPTRANPWITFYCPCLPTPLQECPNTALPTLPSSSSWTSAATECSPRRQTWNHRFHPFPTEKKKKTKIRQGGEGEIPVWGYAPDLNL